MKFHFHSLNRVSPLVLLLALFATCPLFSFGGSTIPAHRLASDAQPLTSAYDCVSVISGNYFISEPQLMIDGPAPLSYTLAYDAGDLSKDSIAWGWHLQLPWRQGNFVRGKQGHTKIFAFASEQSERANLAYSSISFSKWEIPFEIADEMYDLVGYTNVSGGSIGGQTNLHNHRARYLNWRGNYRWGYFELKDGFGTLRYYELYTFCEPYLWRLVREVQPNGYQVFYSYCEPHKLSRIYTTNPSGNTVLHSIDFSYDAAGYTARASTGQSVRYNIDRTSAKRHFNGVSVDDHLSHLREIVPSDAPSSSHHLCGTKRDGLWLQNNRREWPDGRYLNIVHREPDGKVVALQAPAGHDDTPVNVALFHYGKNDTTVADAAGTKTVYRYSNEKRITSIEKCQSNGHPYDKKLFRWDLAGRSKGNLIGTASTDGQGAAYSATNFTYDGSGNIVKEVLFGNLTGRQSAAFSIGSDLQPTSPTDRQETLYQYSTDGRNLRLYEQHSNDLRVSYAYKPGTNLLQHRLTGNATDLFTREFHSYDDDNFLVRTMHDDGISGHPDHLHRVSVRTIKEFTPRKSAPAIGFPEQVVEKYWDPTSGSECQLRRIRYTYNAAEQVVQEDIYDAKNQHRYSLTYAYDDHRNLIAQSDALGQVTLFTYDRNRNKLSEELKGSGVITHFRYDLMNRLIAKEEKHTDGVVLTTSYRYDHLGNKLAEIDAFGNETRFVYDEFSRLIETQSPLQATLSGAQAASTKQTYNCQGQCVSQIDALGNTTQMTYTARNQLVSKRNPDGTEERNEYRIDGTVLKQWNPLGVCTEYSYDTLNRPLEKREFAPDGQHLGTTRYEYNGSQLVKMTNPLQVVTEYQYDGAGRKTAELCCGSRTEYGYDDLGRLSRTKTFFGAGSTDFTVAIQEFDLLDRVIADRVEDASGTLLQKKAYRYDIQGNRTHEYSYHSAADYTVTETRYNTRKQVTQKIDALGACTTITYDLEHRNTLGQRVLLKTTTDPLGQRTAEEHDASGRIIASTTYDAFGNTLAGHKLIYDLAGDSVRRIDDCWTNGILTSQRITDSTFDAGHRITKLTEAVGTSDERSTTYSYNRYGQLESTMLPDGVSLHNSYDGAGRLSRYHASDNSFHYLYTYDLGGNLLQVVDSVHNTTTTRSYNGLNRITSETLANGLRLDYAYDDQGRITQLTLPDASHIRWQYSGCYLKEIMRQNRSQAIYSKRDLVGNVLEAQLLDQAGTIIYRYDELQRPVAINAPSYQEHIPPDGYDAVGNLLKHSINDASGQRECRYRYDALYQLVREEGLRTQTYGYDSLFNRISKGSDLYTLNSLHSLLQAGSTSFTNDARGNPVERQDGTGVTTYQYDALGRLTLVEKGDHRECYRYDSFNRRISTWSYRQGITGSWDEDDIQHFLYTDQNEIGSVDRNGTITQLRMLGDGRGAEIGAAVAVELNGVVYAPIHDLRGNVVSLVNQVGVAVESMQYSAFGEEHASSATLCPWRFCSKRFDNLTGFTCFGRRYYDSGLGRWLTPDPIGYKAGPNLYAYVNNAPLTHFDLYGLHVEEKTVRQTVIDTWYSPKTQGTLRAVGGFAEASFGALLAGTPASSLGFAMLVHGADQFAAGSYSAMSGSYRKTFTEMGLEKVGFSERWASFGNDLISLGACSKALFTSQRIGARGRLSLEDRTLHITPTAEKKFKPYTKGNYRHNLKILTENNPGREMDAHHVLPRQFESTFNKKFNINIHAPEYLQWWEKTSHRASARNYNKMWENFIESNPSATQAEVLEEGKYIMGQFGKTTIY